MKKLLPILFIATFLSCSETKKEEEIQVVEKEQTEFEIPESKYVIIEFQTNWGRLFENAKPTKLSISELKEIEEIIKVAVQDNNENAKKSLEKHNEKNPENKMKETGYELQLKWFKRQYVPVINDKGEKEIWINFFCDDLGNETWKVDLVVVDDGGNCFFNLKVNLTNKSYSELSVNGYA